MCETAAGWGGRSFLAVFCVVSGGTNLVKLAKLRNEVAIRGDVYGCMVYCVARIPWYACTPVMSVVLFCQA